MSRAPFVMPKMEAAFSRTNTVYDSTIGWRFINPLMKQQYGVDSMPETAENVATEYKIERAAQDRMALASQMKAMTAQKTGHLAREITSVTIAQKKGDALVVDQDEQPRETSLETLAKLKLIVRPVGTVTAGNASGINDGACALLLADEATAAKNGDTQSARGRHGHCRCSAASDGPRPGPGDKKGIGAHRLEAGAIGRHRTQ